jgi:hypothetical protein
MWYNILGQVTVRGMESIIRLACIAHQTDYWRRGRTMERLEIRHLSISELTRYVTGNTKYQKPIHTRRPKLAPLSVTSVEQTRKINWGSTLEQMPLLTDVVSYSETTTSNN